jgi:protein-disulfide isomerase
VFKIRNICFACAFAFTAAGYVQNATADEFSPGQKRAIESIVHDYLLKNPEIMIEVMDELQTKQKAASRQKQSDALTKYAKEIYEDPTAFVAGNPNGDVTIVEFFDYNCGYCKHAFAPLMKLLKDDGNIRLILKEFPILGPSSVTATHATMAAKKQGKYFEMYQALYKHKGGLDKDIIMAVARSVGLDTNRLERDMNNPAIEATIKRNEDLASALDINGTPAFIIGKELYPGALDAGQFESAVKAAREARS